MRTTIVAMAATLALSSFAASAQSFADMSRDQIRSEIKSRCMDQMGDYGKSLVLTCMKEDWNAAQKIQDDLDAHPDIAKRCLAQMRDAGYSIVETCIKEDAGAADAIANW